MNKQQLASKIWESANKLRSKIEANEYKDYILGFIFYKFLSDKEERFLRKDGWEDDDFKELTEKNSDTVEYCCRQLGYFIGYDNLFSTWMKKGNDFNVSNVTDALSAFNRLIGSKHKKVFEKIFDTLDTSLTKLGDTSGARTKAISELLRLIKNIPMDGKADYDVLGFIYEYLIGNFAANAGKKAGEFYTPHEVSVLMSEIVANHLSGREKIEIYDPTSGSGSLLINIGQSAARHIKGKNNIKYYAQELKENTYNLTRMNLVMRGILPDNIVTRNGDTLEEDWPFVIKDNAQSPLYVDAVVSNPPYSQHWEPDESKTLDPRYANYGIAPKSKADYAFLLHDLFHLKPDGIMSIVLPHGVLFRGGEEGDIRRNLIENNNIDTIIGLPANIFFGTGIPTIIMVLNQKRKNTDVLIVDASKYFEKVGNNNRLRASDIKRIVDVVVQRKTVDKFSRVVTRDEICQNGYNLNISRYVDSSKKTQSWDILAMMSGGIPSSEINALNVYWNAFPNLRKEIFYSSKTPGYELAVSDVSEAIKNSADVKLFKNNFSFAFGDFYDYLCKNLVDKLPNMEVSITEGEISNNIFERLDTAPLVDKYEAYQMLDDFWTIISSDLETIQREGFAATKCVDPRMVLKKKDGVEEEVQEGWVGRIIPFEIVQQFLLKDETDALRRKEARLDEIAAKYEEIIDSFSEEEKNGDYLNDDNTAFVAKGMKIKIAEIYADVDSDELKALRGYSILLDNKVSKVEKLKYIAAHPEADWQMVEEGKKIYTKSKVNARIKQLQLDYSFPEDSFEGKIISSYKLMDEEKSLKKQISIERIELNQKTKETIENLTDDQVLYLLKLKWITPFVDSINNLPESVVDTLSKEVSSLAQKYSTTLNDLEAEIKQTEKEFSAMLGELTGSEFDMEGLAKLKNLLEESENDDG